MTGMVLIRRLFFALILLSAGKTHALVDPPCLGRFANPITDICWRCMLPISFGPIPIMAEPGLPDTLNPAAPICFCPKPVPPFIRFGLSVGYWEPAIIVDMSRSPSCFVSLNGLKIPTPLIAAEGTSTSEGQKKSRDEGGFYQAVIYENIWAEWLVREIDVLAWEISFLPNYIASLDPTWSDDELNTILNPEAILFGNPVAQAACAGDCVAATAGLPLNPMFWCSGCNGSAYPINGRYQNHVSGTQATALVTEKLIFKLSRMSLMWQSHAHTPDQYCYQHYDPIVDKTQFRTQMVYPIPQTSLSGPGGCCQPFGRTVVPWEAGRESLTDAGASYIVWRKRHVCLGL
jgi:conjugal transfer pilus assembly protein TraU